MTQDFRIRLLIVDDEQTIRRLCITVGESLGFFCLEAESGEAALALLEEQPIHMVLADKVRLVEENLYLRERSETETAVHGIIGNSTGIQNVLRLISRLKDTRTPVLISGESGTGKELVARALHFRGAMANLPFVAVDCGSLVPTLIESELFGYEKGAFTGALRSKQGLLQSADTGTIFLDERGELPLQII